jgi:hypothetical protein
MQTLLVTVGSPRALNEQILMYPVVTSLTLRTSDIVLDKEKLYSLCRMSSVNRY